MSRFHRHPSFITESSSTRTRRALASPGAALSAPLLSRLPVLVLLALPACTSNADPGAQSERAVAVDAYALQDAEEAAYALLDDPRLGLLQGVEAVWTRRVHVDTSGIAHTRVVQTLDNIPVFGGEAIVHTDARGTLRSMSDSLVRDIDVDTTPRLSELEATDLAVVVVVGGGGGWDRVSGLPVADLQILRHDDQDHLTYRVAMRQFQPGHAPAMPVVFIDAHTGDVVWRYDNLKTYTLKDGDKATYDMHAGTDYGAATYGTSSDADLLTTHDAVQGALGFMYSNYGRDSFDGSGTIVSSYGHYGTNYTNAFWDGSKLSFGDGDGSVVSYLGVTDIVAHEFGHAVTDYEADFTYQGESGALSESASDMLGASVEAYIDGVIDDWTFDIGEDCWLTAGEAIRYMSRPSDDGSSRDHYSNRYTGKGDNGGVHYNAGIANHWFYLVSQGGQHHNPAYRSGLTVKPLGIDVAYDIWYRALTSYMTSSTDFAGARAATEAACSDLGHSAKVCGNVSVAWYEVGVGPDPT